MPEIRRNPHRRGTARAVVLDEARAQFAGKGYHATSLRDIAAAADVSETLVYRYFGSKAGLIDAAIIAPAREFVEEFITDWEARPAADRADEMIHDFVVRLIEWVREYRGVVMAWAVDASGNDDIVADEQHGQGVQHLAAAMSRRAGADHDPTDLELAVAFAIGLVLSVVLMDRVLFAPDAPYRDPAVLSEETARFVRAGFLERLR